LRSCASGDALYVQALVLGVLDHELAVDEHVDDVARAAGVNDPARRR
jgi:hypothetical protein